MADEPLQASVRRIAGIPVVDLRGEIAAQAEDVLGRVYSQATQRDEKVIILNFGGVDYINSKGIAYIITLLARARKEGRALMAFGLSEHYLDVFRITRLAEYVELFPSEETALGAAVQTSGT
jgi:anti-anti-sigma factor